MKNPERAHDSIFSGSKGNSIAIKFIYVCIISYPSVNWILLSFFQVLYRDGKTEKLTEDSLNQYLYPKSPGKDEERER